MRQTCYLTIILTAALALLGRAAFANEGLQLFVDFSQLPQEVIKGFETQFFEDLPALHDVTLSDQLPTADVLLQVSGTPIMAGDNVIGYAASLTMLGVRGVDDKGVVLFIYPSVIPLVVGPSHIEWAARQTVLELDAYLDWLVEVGEFQSANVGP